MGIICAGNPGGPPQDPPGLTPNWLWIGPIGGFAACGALIFAISEYHHRTQSGGHTYIQVPLLPLKIVVLLANMLGKDFLAFSYSLSAGFQDFIDYTFTVIRYENLCKSVKISRNFAAFPCLNRKIARELFTLLLCRCRILKYYVLLTKK
jgi:hypothetical protein